MGGKYLVLKNSVRWMVLELVMPRRILYLSFHWLAFGSFSKEKQEFAYDIISFLLALEIIGFQTLNILFKVQSLSCQENIGNLLYILFSFAKL